MVWEEPSPGAHGYVWGYCKLSSPRIHFQPEVLKGSICNICQGPYVKLFLQGAQTIADIMQRRVAKYGDESGKLI